MALSHAYGGFEPASAHQNVKKVWDGLVHEQVVNKSAFKDLIGVDKGGEGSLDNEVANKPIVQKTQLKKESGDQITLNLIRSNNTLGGTFYNDGKSGSTQLVDAEDTLAVHNFKCKIGHFRVGTEVDGKMTEQRLPFDVMKAATNAGSQKMASFMDGGLFFAVYAGYSPNIFREYGISAAVPVTHPNRIFGKGQTALTDVSTADVFDTAMLEIERYFVVKENINPIMIDGEPHWLHLCDPANGRTLRADSAWVDGNAFAQPRGNGNPLFNNALGKWAGIIVKETNKVSTAKAYSGLTVSSDAITLAADTMGAGVSATAVYMNVLLGANAVARAYGMESYLARRKEDDYGNIAGFAVGSIYGDARADWKLSQDSGVDSTNVNQSSAIIYAYGASVTVPTTWS